MSEPGEPRLTWSVEEAAVVLGLGRTAMYQAIRRGEVPAVRVGGRLLVPKEAVLRMLDRQRVTDE